MGHEHAHSGNGTAKAATVTLLVNATLTALKWAAFIVTGSPSIFGEAAHSTADAANPLLLWFGYRRSDRPAHGRHPLGHGREAFFWSLIAAQMMLLVGSCLTAANGIAYLRSGRTPHHSMLALGVMLLALLGESWSLTVTWRGLRRGVGGKGTGGSKNPVLLALLVENGTDMLGVVLALSGYGLYLLTGSPVWDALFSLAIAALLAGTSLFLIKRNLSLITGEVAPEQVIDDIAAAARSVPAVYEVVNVTATMAGAERVACRLTVRLDRSYLIRTWYAEPFSCDRSAEAIIWITGRLTAERGRIEAAVRERLPEMTDVTVHCL